MFKGRVHVCALQHVSEHARTHAHTLEEEFLLDAKHLFDVRHSGGWRGSVGGGAFVRRVCSSKNRQKICQ